MTSAPPIILTAALDEGAAAWFDDLRRTYYPADRNRLPAHLTLFHALPGAQEALVGDTLKAACARAAPMRLQVKGPWSLGRGVAYRMEGPELSAFRGELASAFAPWLTPQDRAPFRPHVTVQNKAEPADARRLLETLQQAFTPFEIEAQGVDVWAYLGGPWGAIAHVPFSQARDLGSAPP